MSHCTYCPKEPHEACGLSCQENYDGLLKDREEDSVVVNDDPASGGRSYGW